MLDGGSLSEPRTGHTATLLPTGDVLLVDGLTKGATLDEQEMLVTAELWRELRGTDPDARPMLAPLTGAATPGAPLTVTGSGLLVPSLGTGGFQPSPSNKAVGVWVPLEGPTSIGLLTEWSPNAAVWRPTSSPFAGPGLLFAVTNGVLSNGVSVTLEQSAAGKPCSADGGCATGFCADAVCCDTRCDGACEACSEDKSGAESGTCTPVPSGADPDAECGDQSAETCGTIGGCDGSGACMRYADGTDCSAGGEVCYAGVCGGAECVDGHLVVSGHGERDCSPFRCAPGDKSCFEAPCRSNLECIDGLACSADGLCVLLGGEAGLDGCACRAAAARSNAVGLLGWSAIAAFVVTTMRRRRSLFSARAANPSCSPTGR
jgi:hypothetical protein